MKKAIFLASFLCFLPFTLHAVETINSVYFEGAAPVAVDGDLSDWTFVTTESIPITHTMLNWWNNHPDSKIPLKSTEDLSGSFNCFYDAYNLYIAVRVADDQFISGREPFAFNHFGDCVEIAFNGESDKWFESGNYGQVRIFADCRSGKTFVEMGALFSPLQSFINILEYENLGLHAVLKQNESGYTVEVSIPYAFLGWTRFEPNRQIGLNIKINDVDENGYKDCALIWAQDNDPEETQWHNKVLFGSSIELSNNSQQNSNSESSNKNIVAILGKPDGNQSVSNLIDIYRAYSQKDYIETERLLNLNPGKDKYWSQLFLGFIRFDTKNYRESGQILESLANESPDLCVSRKALYQAGRAYMRAGDKMKALDIFGEVLLSEVELHSSVEFIIYGILGESVAELIKDEPADSPLIKRKNEIIGQFVEAYCKEIDLKPKDVPFNFQLIKRGLNQLKSYDSSLKLLEKIENTSLDQKIKGKAKLERAKCYYYLGDYEHSAQLGKELLNLSDPNINLNAQMLILSSERNLSQK
jgi:tetratricopeptide (TPR) repeat protein